MEVPHQVQAIVRYVVDRSKSRVPEGVSRELLKAAQRFKVKLAGVFSCEAARR